MVVGFAALRFRVRRLGCYCSGMVLAAIAPTRPADSRPSGALCRGRSGTFSLRCFDSVRVGIVPHFASALSQLMASVSRRGARRGFTSCRGATVELESKGN